MKVEYFYVDDEGHTVDLETVNDEMWEYAIEKLDMDPDEVTNGQLEPVVSYTGCFIAVENRADYKGYIRREWVDRHIKRYNHLTQFPDEMLAILKTFLTVKYDFVVEF